MYSVASQLHMLSMPGSIPAAHTIVGTGGTVLGDKQGCVDPDPGFWPNLDPDPDLDPDPGL